MSKSVVFERDLLYPTGNLSEPGSIHIEVLGPNKKSKMPIVIESKTAHSPVDYINSIIGIMQGDIFDRININVKANADLYIKSSAELKQRFGEHNYIKIVFEGNNINYCAVDDIDE